MPYTPADFPIKYFDDAQAAFVAASEAAAASGGRTQAGILYTQGHRRFVCTSLRVPLLLQLIQEVRPPTKKELQDYDLNSRHNRPLDSGHKQIIKQYLVDEDRYLLPPILLNSRTPLQLFVVKSPTATEICMFVLPPNEYLYVTDGQHRIEGLRAAREYKESLDEDSVAVAIVEETDLHKIHQDFYDAAQTKPLSASLLVQFDHREPLNALTRQVIRGATIFHNRVDALAKVIGKTSLKLYTANMVKRAVSAMLTGNPWDEIGAGALAEKAPDIWYERIVAFLEVYTKENPQWAEIVHRTPESGLTVEIPELRRECLNVVGSGLFVIGGVAHGIFADSPTESGALTPQQLQYTHRLAKEIDWRRTNPLWLRSIVDPVTGIQPHRTALYLAIADVKKAIGVQTTAKENELIDKKDHPEQYTEAIPSAAAHAVAMN